MIDHKTLIKKTVRNKDLMETMMRLTVGNDDLLLGNFTIINGFPTNLTLELD